MKKPLSLQRSFKVHFRLVVLGWLRKSEGCDIWSLRLREVLSRESNYLRRPHFFLKNRSDEFFLHESADSEMLTYAKYAPLSLPCFAQK